MTSRSGESDLPVLADTLNNSLPWPCCPRGSQKAMIRIDAIPSGDAVFFDGSDIKAQLWEISENLHRAELTTLEYGEQVARWVELKNTANASEQLTRETWST